MQRSEMSAAEAQREARRRWGLAGHARLEREGRVWWRKVGTIGAFPAEVAFGRGHTWEAAFAAAEVRGLGVVR